MTESILNKFYRPILFFFLLPIFQMIVGMIFSLQYNALNILSFIVFYLFILFNQMLENILLRIPNSDFSFSKRFFFTVEFLNILTILYFGLRHSWIAGIVSLLFSLIIQCQFLFSYYNLEYYAVIFTVILKSIFFNSFSFYVGTGFIQFRFIPYFIGLLLPLFLYEVARIRPEMNKKSIAVVCLLSYLIGVALLVQHLGALSLILILSVPFAFWLLKDEFNRKSSAVYTINFALFYVILLMIAIIK